MERLFVSPRVLPVLNTIFINDIELRLDIEKDPQYRHP